MSNLGKNKYVYGDKVKFPFNGEIKEGTVYIVDKYGTFEFPNDVCYDILCEENCYKTEINPTGSCLYKHIRESELIND